MPASSRCAACATRRCRCWRGAASGLDGVQWVDKVAEISSVLGRYRAYMGWVVLGAYVVVFAVLFPRYRGRTWRVLAPTASGQPSPRWPSSASPASRCSCSTCWR